MSFIELNCSPDLHQMTRYSLSNSSTITAELLNVRIFSYIIPVVKIPPLV